jgi:hypothetical protein
MSFIMRACYNHSMKRIWVVVVIIVLVVAGIGWWSWNQLHGALSGGSSGTLKFTAEGVKVSVPCVSRGSLTSEDVTLYTANPDTLMKYLALQQVKTCSAPIACMPKGFDGTTLYLDPNCYFDTGDGSTYSQVFKALTQFFGDGKLLIGARQLESDPVGKLITIPPYYFITTEQGVEVVRTQDASLDKFWKDLNVTPSITVDGDTANVNVTLSSYDNNLTYAIALNVEHFMKVNNVVISVNGLEAYHHSVPYALKLAQVADGFLVTGEAQDLSELQSSMLFATLNDSGSVVTVKLDPDTTSEDYTTMLAILDTTRGKTVKIVAGPYAFLGSFPSQF